MERNAKHNNYTAEHIVNSVRRTIKHITLILIIKPRYNLSIQIII